jgi:hypothetical protein
MNARSQAAVSGQRPGQWPATGARDRADYDRTSSDGASEARPPGHPGRGTAREGAQRCDW